MDVFAGGASDRKRIVRIEMATRQDQNETEDTEQRPCRFALKFAIGGQFVKCLLQKPVLIPVLAHLFMETTYERVVVVCGAWSEIASTSMVGVQCDARLHCVDPLSAVSPTESEVFLVTRASRTKHKGDE